MTVIATSPRTLRVFVVEGQVLFGKALCQVFALEQGIHIVGDAPTVSTAVIAQARPDLVVLDLDGPIKLGEALEACRTAAPHARICVLSMRAQPEVTQHCLTFGVEGYIIKDVTPSELINAIRIVASGETYIDSRVAGDLLRRRMSNGRSTFSDLSVRETDVVRLIAEGLSNKEISVRLNLSEKAIKNHISRIFSKLSICARSQAAVYATKIGLV